MKRNTSRARHKQAGFSLLEMMIVVALMMIVAGISFVTLRPAMRQQRLSNAYNTTLMAMRQAREHAVAQRTSYSVTFNTATTPHSVTVAPTFAGFQGAKASVTYELPYDIRFDNEAGIPTNNLYTPDQFGTGGLAVDFGYTGQGLGAGGKSVIYFCPDGSAQDDSGVVGQCTGNVNNGVVYIARQGDLYSSRAITVWGATGRIRGWRLYNSGGPTWQRQ